MARGDIVIQVELRPCLVENNKALFHRWVNELNGTTKGLIEDDHGKVHLVKPEEIQFLDRKIKQYAFIMEEV